MDWDFLTRLVDQLPVAIFGKDARPGREGRFRIWNRRAEVLFGIPAQEILDKTDFDLFPRDQAEFFTAKDAEVMREGKRLEIPREPVDSPTLGRRLVRTVKVPLYAPDGAPEMLVGISEDITQLSAQEEALRTSEHSLAEAQRIGHMGNWEWEIPTGALRWSDEIYRIFGLEPGAFEPTYAAFLDRIHPQDRALVEGAVTRALEGLETYTIDHRVLRPSGEVLVVHEQGEVVRDPEGRPERMLGTVQDLTERTAMERLQNEFVSVVSHELRTPLTAIRGALGLILGSPRLDVPPETRELLNMALRNTERLGLLVNDILDLSRIESGALALDLTDLDLNRVVARAVEAHAPIGGSRDVRLVFTEGPGIRIRADEFRLQQVLGNLLANAIKFSPDGGAVDIATASTGPRATVSVTNRGPMIPMEFRARIFQKFAQADGSDSRSKGGSGLGLNISKALLERMGGYIAFESHPDHTRFWCELPRLP